MSETPGVPSQPGTAQLERLQQLDRRIAQTVGQLIGSLQEEVDRHLSEATGELQRLFEKMKPATPDLSGAFLQPEDLSDLMPPAPPPVSVEVPVPVRVSLNESLAPLLAGLARIDGESGQAPILKALLEESQRFATRAGFLLIRGGEIRGWAAQDLPEAALQATNFASLGGPFTRLLSADGTVVLAAGDCAQVAEALGVEAAAAGVLVPFQIRGQLAGALYADRVGNGEELAVSALQVLAYGAAQALETSQLRKGSSFALRLGAGEQLPEPPAAPAAVPAASAAAAFYAAPEPAYEAPAPAAEREPSYEAPEPEYEVHTSYVSGYVEETLPADGYDPLAAEPEPAAPAYEAPSYEAPAYEAPAYEAPSYAAPAADAADSYAAEPEPSYEASSYGAASYEAPTYPAPSHETFEAPAYEAPAMETPSFAAPAYEPPAYEPPAVEAPSYAIDYEAPAYEAPTYEPPAYEAPSYQAPAYETPSYEAPAYEAPSYEAPSVASSSFEPAYEAPSYEVPSYEAPSEAAPSYEISYPTSFEAPAAPAYEPPVYESPAYEAPAYEPPAYDAASFEVPAIEPASFEMVPEETVTELDAPPAFEVSYESASYEVTYEPASEPSSFDTTFEPAAAAEYAATEDVRFAREPAYELPSEEEIARENQPEPALEDTNIWEAEEDDEPTQIGQSTAAVQQVEVSPAAAPAAPVPQVAPGGLGQQTVRLDISQLQSHATQLAQERYGDDTADVAPPATTAWSPPPAAPAYAPTYSPPSFATPEPAYGGAAYDQSEAPTMLGRGPMPAAPAPPPPSPAGFAGPAATEQAPGGFGAGGFGAGEAKEPGGSTEVRPPADLVGPGRAFGAPAAGPRPAGGGGVEESLREEARRLARLLVSEIKLYNEEIIDEGRRSGNIYDRLKDDIDRSRQMYEERIDPRLTDQEDYFYQELVQRLAGGDVKLLGL